MAKRVSELRTAGKAGNTSREYLLLSNIDSNSSTKIALNDVFPTLQSGKSTTLSTRSGAASGALDLFIGGGVGSSVANTDKSVLIFKGLKALDQLNNALQLFTETSNADPNKQNLIIELDQRAIDLQYSDNSTSDFLSATGGSNPLNLTSTPLQGTLTVARGGTGLGTIPAGSLLVGNGTSNVQTVASLPTASILVGAGSGNAPTQLAVGVNNYVLTADSTAPTGLKWAKPTINAATFTSDLNMQSNDIILGSGFITGSGSAAGISLSSSSNYVYIGGGTKYFDSVLNIAGNVAIGSNTGTSAQNIQMTSCSSGASPALSIKGSTNLDGNDGGDINIVGGTGQTNGDGGDVSLNGGTPDGTGTAGYVYLKTNNNVGLSVDENQDVNVTNNLTLSQGKTIELRGTETVTQLTSITTAVTLNATAGVIVLHATAISGHTSHYFTFNNSLINSRSIILLTCEVDGAEASGAGLTAQLADRAAGSVKIRVSNTGNAASTTNHAIHFLIMNVYV
jgi:hypothetical protein